MAKALSDEGRDLLFREARSHNFWLERPVDDEQLSEIYELMKWGPTSANGCPARIAFLRTKAAKERLIPALDSLNLDKMMSAPVVAIVGYDLAFFSKLPILMPHAPTMRDYFAGSEALAHSTAFRNSSLQGAYFILAARAVGLDCGPVSGFDNNKVDEAFFSEDIFDGDVVRSNFLCGLGYGDHTRAYPRNPRLEFDRACVLL